MGKMGKHGIAGFVWGSVLGAGIFMAALLGNSMKAEAAEWVRINGTQIADPSTDNAVWSYADGVLTLRGTLDARSTGCRGIEFGGDLTVLAQGGAKILSDSQEGIYGSGNLVLDGDADMAVETQGPYAVYAGGNITKTGNGELTAVSTGSGSQGIYAGLSLYVKGGGIVGKGLNYGVRAGEGVYVTSANLIGRGEYNAGIRARDISFNLGETGYVLGKTYQGEWGIRGDQSLKYIGSVEKPADVKVKDSKWDGYVFYDVWGKTVQEIEIGKYTRNTATPGSSTKSLNQDVLKSMNYKPAELTTWEQVLMALARLQPSDITNADEYGGAAVLEVNIQETSGYIPPDAVNVIAGKEGVGLHFYLGNGVSAVCMGSGIGTGYTGAGFGYTGNTARVNGKTEKTIDFEQKEWIGMPMAFHVNLENAVPGGTADIYTEDTQGNRTPVTQCTVGENGNISFMTASKEKFVIVY